MIQERQKSPWLWWDPYFSRTKKGKDYARYLDVMHSFTRSVIKSRTEQLISDDAGRKRAKRLAFLDMLLTVSDGKNFLSQSDIQEEVDTFMFEGNYLEDYFDLLPIEKNYHHYWCSTIINNQML